MTTMKNHINAETIKKLEKEIAWHSEQVISAREAGFDKFAAEEHSRIMGMIEVLVTLGYSIDHVDGKTVIIGA